jgi:preprotein translocase subunit SecA
VIYEQRRRVLEGADLSDEVRSWIDEVVERVVLQYTDSEYTEEWDLAALVQAMNDLYGSDITVAELTDPEEGIELSREALIEEFRDDARDEYAAKETEVEQLEAGLMRNLERYIILQVVDTRWREHLENMDYLREGVHLRAMAQKDPLVEYRAEGHSMFEELGLAIHEEVVQLLFHAELEPGDSAELQELQEAEARNGGGLAYEHQSLAGAQAIAAAGLEGGFDGGAAPAGAAVTAGTVGGGATSVMTQQRVTSEHEKIGRNDPCWCGSGKKFKKCHGA